MKKNLIPVLILLCTSRGAFAQITITLNDVQSLWSLGSSSVTNLDTIVSSVNIGQPGSTSWNFTGLASHLSFTTTQVDPSSTPYGANYPGAAYARHANGSIPGISSESWGYASLANSNALFHGGVSTVTPAPGLTIATYQYFAPLEIELHLPVTFATSWPYGGIETDISFRIVPPPDTVTTTLNVVETADAYGAMTMPGGSAVNALRLRRDERRMSSRTGYSRHITYIFTARTGESVVVETNDTSSNSGSIPVEGVTWIRPTAMPVVGELEVPPGEMMLYQNYPNPFNPSTTLRYDVPIATRVSLKVYDILGREVATLVDDVQQPGSKSVQFEAGRFASGVYFYRMAAGKFISTKKMVVMK